jgi:hypothetical protein
MVGLCLYIILADWGDLGRSFFLATGVVMGLVGLVILFTSKIGCQGINAQMRSFGIYVASLFVHSLSQFSVLQDSGLDREYYSSTHFWNY